jgi:methionyl aminopeptidase
MIVQIKSEKEIRGFIKAGREAGRILSKLLHHTQCGCTPLEINNIAIEECKKINANPIFLNFEGFPAAICLSKNRTLVHGVPDNIPLKYGDVVSIDFGIEIDGFIGDIADTIIVGKGKEDDKNAKLISECRCALFKGIQAAVPGNKLNEIGKIIERVAIKNKYKIPNKYGGHGINRGELHAPPFVCNKLDNYNNFTLRHGVVLAIEPMFIIGKSNKTKVSHDGWSVFTDGISAHCEHTIVVHNDGPIILTRRDYE